MEPIQCWARHGDAVRQAIEVGKCVPRATAREECTEEGLWLAIARGLLQSWAGSFPAPRWAPAIPLEGLVSAPSAARFAGLYSLRKAG
jgi:hypothetical protein